MNHSFEAKVTAWKIIGESVCETFLTDSAATSFSIEIPVTVKENIDGQKVTSPSTRRLNQTYLNKSEAMIMAKHFNDVFNAGRLFARQELKHWMNNI